MKSDYTLFLLHYFLSVVILLICQAFGLDDRFFFSVLVVTLGFTIYFTLKLFMRFPTERFNPFLILSIIYTAQFSISTLLSKSNVIVTWDKLLLYYDGINNMNVLNAHILAYAFSFLTLLCAFFLSLTKLWSTAHRLLSNALRNDRKALAFFTIIISVTELLLIVTGQVTLQGESLQDKNLQDLEVNPFVAIVNPIACVAVFITAYLYSNTRQKRWILLILVQFVWFFLWGRRNIGYFGFLVFLGFFFDRRVQVLFNWRGIKSAATALFLVGVIVASANLYHQLRIVGGVGLLQDLNVHNVSTVTQLYLESDSEELKVANEFNKEVRALSTTAAVSKYDKILRSQDVRYGYGFEIYNSLLRATPSGYFVDKAETPVMEGLASILTNNAVKYDWDIGDSLILESMIDFGYWGVLIYPLVLFIILGIAYLLAVLWKDPIVMLVFMVTVFFSIWSMAEGGIGVLFLTFRVNLLILFLILVMRIFNRYAILSRNRTTLQIAE